MANKIVVCALCSQDFTRRYSADRHNQNLHHGQGKIVRMIDYVIGRIAGEYNAANPLAYRSSYKRQASSSTRYDSKAFRFPLDAKVTVAHDTSQQKSSAALPVDKEHATAQQQPNSNSVQHSTTTTIEFTTKFERIQELARTLYGPENAEALVKELDLAIIENGGKDEILDGYLEKLKNLMNMKIAYHHYNSAASKEVSKHPPLHGHDVAKLSELLRAKLEKIEELLTLRLKNPNAVFEEIKRIIKVCNEQPLRQNFILDLELNSLGGTPQTNNQHENKTSLL